MDAGWKEVGPYLLHDAVAYAEWNANTGHSTVSLSRGKTVEELQAGVNLSGAVENWVSPSSVKTQVKDAYNEIKQGKPRGDLP